MHAAIRSRREGESTPKKPRRHSKAKNIKANNLLVEMMQRGASITEVQAAWKTKTGLDTTEAAWRSRSWRLDAKGLTGVKEHESPERDTRMADDEGDYESIKGLRFRAVNSQYTPDSSPYLRQPFGIHDEKIDTSSGSTSRQISDQCLMVA